MSVIMHRLVVVLIGVVVLVKTDVDVRRCFETAAFNGGCCQFNITEEKNAVLKECAEKSNRDPQSCAFETCYGKKFGFLLSNGTVDKTSLETMIEQDFENHTDIMEIAKQKCLIDDLRFYGPPHMCQVKKVENCLRVHTVLNCPQWADTEHCNKVKKIINECESVYP